MYGNPIDLSKEFHPVPKPGPRGKKPKKPLNKMGKRTSAWAEGQPKLKEIFRENAITSCEIQLEGCQKGYLLGFAHISRRKHYSAEELSDPHIVVLACQHCHTIVDDPSQTEQDIAEAMLQDIVYKRGW